METDSINFENLWQQQTAKQLPTNDLLKRADTFTRSNSRRIFSTTIAFSLTSFFICSIWISYDPQLFTSKLGIILIILSMAIYGYSLNQQYPVLKNLDISTSNKEYLINLLALKKNQLFLHTTLLNFYFILLSAGILLYMNEPVQNMTLPLAIIAYTFTIGWLVFNWLYNRPKHINMQQTKINELISKFENLQKQLNQE